MWVVLVPVLRSNDQVPPPCSRGGGELRIDELGVGDRGGEDRASNRCGHVGQRRGWACCWANFGRESCLSIYVWGRGKGVGTGESCRVHAVGLEAAVR